ncbi:MAG: putative sulfate exporter family transporter, partial [Alphaproteobacteria bacterium]|nr:putative sulfate exporter family transporter [Alphaproteobacteria bacterium]
EALNSAMTTKLLRNSFLVVLIPLIAYLYTKDENINVKKSIKNFFPFFVLAFIILALVRTMGDFVFDGTNEVFYWEEFIVQSKKLSIYLILFAMVALGLQTNIKSIFNLGIKPLLIGFAASASVGVLSVLYLLFLVPQMVN